MRYGLIERLKQLREEKELRQGDIAKVLNITASAYGFYEQKRIEPNIEVLNKLASFYDVSVDYILGRTDIRNMREVTGLNLEELSRQDIEYVKIIVRAFREKQKKDFEG